MQGVATETFFGVLETIILEAFAKGITSFWGVSGKPQC